MTPQVALDSLVLVGAFPRDSERIAGGVQASTYGLCKSLLEQNLVRKITVISLPTSRADKLDVQPGEKLQVFYIDMPGGFAISTAWRIPFALQMAQLRRASVVHVHGSGLFQLAFAAVSRWRNLPLVWTVHGIAAKETWDGFQRRKSVANFVRWAVYTGQEWLLSCLCHDTVVDTPYVRDHFPGRRRRAHVIPQGIFLDEFNDRRCKPAGAPLVVSVGNISPRKGPDLLIKAFARVVDVVPQAKLVIIGPIGDAGYHASVTQRIGAAGLGDRVRLIVDASRKEVLDFLFLADLFALHSREESQGIALCEALAAGLPVIATNVGGIPYVVASSETGILVPYGHVEAFAEALVQILCDQELRSRMSCSARRAAESFDWSRISHQVCLVYHDAIRRQTSNLGGYLQRRS